jgi:ABC-type dipeptide/oligopeptide/nickel transport system ATPase component
MSTETTRARRPATASRPPRAAQHGDRLVVDDLHLTGPAGPLVHGVSFAVEPGEALGIVGESGSGKSLTCRSVLGILPRAVTITGGSARFGDTDLFALDESGWQQVRARRISAVFQDPGSYLNPSIVVGKQLAEVLRVHLGMGRREAFADAVRRLDELGIRDPELVAKQYPHELSGGMLQRVLIAIAVATDPELLIADEATTALDVTVQAEVLDLLAGLRAERGLSLVLVSHDLAVVAQVCDRVIVVKDGVVVEEGPVDRVLRDPSHEYTRRLITDHDAYGLERVLAPAAPEEELA